MIAMVFHDNTMFGFALVLPVLIVCFTLAAHRRRAVLKGLYRDRPTFPTGTARRRLIGPNL